MEKDVASTRRKLVFYLYFIVGFLAMTITRHAGVSFGDSIPHFPLLIGVSVIVVLFLIDEVFIRLSK